MYQVTGDVAGYHSPWRAFRYKGGSRYRNASWASSDNSGGLFTREPVVGRGRATSRPSGDPAVIPPPHIPPIGHPVSLVYTDPLFRATRDIGRHFAGSRRVRGLLSALARRPITLFQVVLAVARLPVVELSISDEHAAALFSPEFEPIGAPIYGGRLAQAVLDLEPDDQSYLSGRHRQALRTNINKARKLGVEVSPAASYREWSAATREVLRSRPAGPEMITRLRPPPDRQDMGYFVAVDDGGRPVAISVAAIFADCAVLVLSLSAPHHPAASSSRYLLHTCMRSDLRNRGVRYLIAGTGVCDAPGLHYFQHLLGYEVRNLRIRVRGTSEAVRTFPPDTCEEAAGEFALCPPQP